MIEGVSKATTGPQNVVPRQAGCEAPAAPGALPLRRAVRPDPAWRRARERPPLSCRGRSRDLLDHAGFDTYDSLYRARDIFEVDSLVIVTQKFHLPRSVYISKALGIETYGYVADKRAYQNSERYEMRELLARIKAFFNVIFHSKPRYLGDVIPIVGDGRMSWD